MSLLYVNVVKRRLRQTGPRILTIIALYLITIPFLFYGFLLYLVSLAGTDLSQAAQTNQTDGTAFFWPVLLPLIAGTAILIKKKWGWHILLSYLAGCIAMLFIYAPIITVPMIANSVVIIALAGFYPRIKHFVKNEILLRQERGLRRSERFPLELKVKVNNRALKTSNISKSGILVDWPNCTKQENDPVKVHLSLDGKDHKLEAGVAHTNGRIGIAFRNLDSSTRREISRSLKLVSRQERIAA